MSDSETALAVAAAIAALRDDEEEDSTQAVTENATSDAPAGEPGSNGDGNEEGEKMEVTPEVEKPKPKTKVLSCTLCTKPLSAENTQMGGSNSRDEYERMMRVVCKLLCVDNHPSLKRWQFRHGEEPKKLCCDECCEVIFNLGSLQSIIDRTKLAINKKLEWILKSVADSAAEQSDEVEKVFFVPRNDIFRKEILEVCKRRRNANSNNGLVDSEDEEELVNTGTQTDVSGDASFADVRTKAGLKYFDDRSDRPSYSFDDTNMDTYSDHNDDMSFDTTYDNDESSYATSSQKKTNSSTKKASVSASSAAAAAKQAKRGRPTKRPTKYDESDDDIEILEEKKSNKPKARGQPPPKTPKLDARELVKVEYSSETGRPKRSTAAKRPNYQMLAGDDDDYSSYRRTSSVSNSKPDGSDWTSKNKKPATTPRKEVTLSAIPIVKDASGKTYFEGVEIVRTDKSITCKHLGCYYVVDGSGYNAFERIKAHIHETHIGEGALPDIY